MAMALNDTGTPARIAGDDLTVSSVDQGQFHGLVPLEPRLLMAATPAQIADALDLPAGTTVTYTGDPTAVATRTGSSLFLFPTGGDDYLFLSTGDAEDVDSLPNSSGSQGTDLGESGEAGDEATISFTLTVPDFGAATASLKIDFTFLSEEFPEFVGSSFNDTLSVLIDGNDIALDQAGNVMNVNNALFDGSLSTNGTFFDGRTEVLTAGYSIPAGQTTIDVVISIKDEGDGIYDSAAIIDNVRFEPSQVVYLDFDGADVDDFFGYGTDYDVPAFSATDINGVPSQTQQAIDTIVKQLQDKFAGYDIIFTSEVPEFDDYMTVVVGGSNLSPINIVPGKHPVLASQIGGQASFKQFYEATNPNLKNKRWTLYGSAQLQKGSPDLNNAVLDDMAVVFSEEFDARNPFANIADLVNVIAHQVANNLGARDVTNNFDGDILKVNPLPRRTAGFTKGTKPLALQRWFDGARRLNTVQYFNSIIGASSGGKSTLTTRGQAEPTSNLPHFKLNVVTGTPIYNAVVGVVPGTGSLSRQDDGAITFDVGTIDGSIFVPLPLQYPDARIFIYGSTSPGGPINVFSGSPGKDGVLSFADTQLDLFKRNGDPITSIALRTGTPQSSTPFDTILIEESPFTADGFLYGNKGTFTDSDGDRYTIELKGRGAVAFDKLQDNKGFGGIQNLTLEGTDDSSRLYITVKKGGRKGDGQVDALFINGERIGRIIAPQVNIANTLEFDYLFSLDVNHLRDLATVKVNSPNVKDPTRIDASIIGRNATIDVDGTLDLKAWSTLFGSTVNAAAANNITIVGAKRMKGNFDGNLILNENGDDLEGAGVGLQGNAFNFIRVKNDARFGTWTMNGNGGRILLGGVARNLNVDFDFATITQIVADQLVNSTIDVDRRVGQLRVQRAVGGSFTTGTMGELRATGTRKLKGLRGSFDTPVTLTGDFTGRDDVITIQRAIVQSVSNVTWDITGPVNLMSIGNANAFTLNADGNVNRLSINQSNAATVDVTGLLNNFTTQTVRNSSIEAADINFVNARKSVLNSTIAADNSINTVQAGGLFGTDITAGVDPAFNLDTLSPAASRFDVFDNLSGSIQNVVVKTRGGKKRITTSDSKVVAFNVASVNFGTLNANNGGQFLGVAGVNVQSVTATNSGTVVPPAGDPDGVVPIAGDAQILLL